MRLLAVLTVSFFSMSSIYTDTPSMSEAERALLRDRDDVKTLVVLGASYAGSWPIEHAGPYRIVNLGIGGSETSDMLNRFDGEVLPLKPEVVLIWGFINDITRSSSHDLSGKLKQTEENLELLIMKCRENQIIPIAATETTRPLYVSWDQRAVHFLYKLVGRETYAVFVNKHVDLVNAWLMNYAEKQNVPVFDIFSLLNDESGARAARYSLPDGSHLTEAAYDRLSEAFTSWIERSGLGT